MITNYANYGPYVDLIKESDLIINVDDINNRTWAVHFNSIFNILKDGIELDEIQQLFITLYFPEYLPFPNDKDVTVRLSLIDYFINLIMWRLFTEINEPIRPKYIIFEENITKDVIKNFIDNYFIIPNIGKIDITHLNNVIDKALSSFSNIETFELYLANTINIEDNITLMNQNKEFYDILHLDLSNVPFEDVNVIGAEMTTKMINIIMNSDHCLRDSFRAKEAINRDQYKEFAGSIGSKPNGEGGIFPWIINSNYLNGGLKTLAEYFIESSAGRYAQILSKQNVGKSGDFSRILGLNNQDTVLHQNPNHVCDTVNFQELYVTDEKTLCMLKNRWYRLYPMGIEQMIDYRRDKHLIGKTILLRSPMTCQTAADGDGVCYRCYSNLAYINNNINIGKIAAELLTEQLTQRLLSAKHLLKAKIKPINWVPEFYSFFIQDTNIIALDENLENLNYKLLIDQDSIEMEDEDNEEGIDNEFINEFMVQDDRGNVISISTLTKEDNLYISSELNQILNDNKKTLKKDDMLIVNFSELVEIPLFSITIHNNELTASLNVIKELLNKNTVTKAQNRHSILQSLIKAINEGGLSLDSIHLEILLMNQIRDHEDVLEHPDWTLYNSQYQLLTLNQALTNHPSITTSLSYQKLAKALYSPLSYRKKSPSFMDVFFMEQPQKYLNKEILSTKKPKEDGIINPIEIMEEKVD